MELLKNYLKVPLTARDGLLDTGTTDRFRIMSLLFLVLVSLKEAIISPPRGRNPIRLSHNLYHAKPAMTKQSTKACGFQVTLASK